jgi:hypothetical protein
MLGQKLLFNGEKSLRTLMVVRRVRKQLEGTR